MQFTTRAISALTRRRRKTVALYGMVLARDWKRNNATFGLIAVTAVILISQQMDQDENKKPPLDPLFLRPLYPPTTITLCEHAAAAKESTSFQVMAALDAKDEVQRIRMAQVLHDLHELAQTHGEKVKREGALGRVFKYVKRLTGRPPPVIDETVQKASAPVSKPVISASTSKKMVEAHQFTEKKPLEAKQAQHMIDELNDGTLFNFETLMSLLETARSVLGRDETLVNLKGRSERVIVVGDLHGSLSSLQYVLNLIGNGRIGDDTIVIFNGDFVDRGHKSLEVMGVLLILKLAYPNHVFLLRGNHEDVLVSAAYGFQDEVVEKYGDNLADDLWDGFDNVFCALPIAAVTDTAAVLHGGLPGRDFTLEDLREISLEDRASIQSLVEPKTDTAHLIQGLLWSDPSSQEGIRHNTTRSVGVFYGPDVVSDFLEREGLKYLIRGHEVVEQGANMIDCGAGREVVTVFSHSEYPNGRGSNMGAYVQLDGSDGDYELVRFSRDTKFRGKNAKDSLNSKDPYVDALKALIASNKNKLSRAFDEMAPWGTATFSQYEEIMARVLELPDVPWMALLPSLVHGEVDDENIDWRSFLALYTASVADKSCEESNIGMEIMHANHRMLMTVFKFLDFDGDGTITKEEFLKGVALLNNRLPQDRRLKDAEKIFHIMDADRSGYLDFAEFEEVFKVM